MHRRSLIAGALSAPLAAAGRRAVAADGAPVIRSLELFRIRVNRRGDWLLVRVTASNGKTGLGDASHGGPVEQQTMLLKALFQAIEGQSIFGVERLRLAAQPVVARDPRLGATASSALEQALWDLQGKTVQRPVSDLFEGALRNSIRLYANINRAVVDRTPQGFAEYARRAVEDGFDAVKLAPFDGMPADLPDGAEAERWLQLGLDCAKEVRQTIGPKRDLLIDVHSHMNRERGLRLAKSFEALRLFWLEEVTPPQPLSDLAAVNSAAKMPTAGGESIYGVTGFYRYLTANTVRVAMPDVKCCGGLLELKKIAGLAEGAGLQVSPHGPASPVGDMAAAQVSATLANFLILEHAYGEVPWRSELIRPAEKIENGRLELSDAPGFGIELNEASVARHLA